MNQKNFSVNKCIYCGGVGETDEHIIPLALGGITKLLKASCEFCRDITSRCERNPLKENWAEARAVLGYPSRRRNFVYEKFPLEVIYKDGSKGILKLSKSEAPGLTIFIEYQLPAFFNPNNYKSGVMINGSRLISFGNITLEALLKKYNLKKIKPKATYKGTNFGKMLAKIAYCASIAQFGLDSFEQCFVLPALLNKKDDIGFWVGCDNKGSIVPLIGKQSYNNVIKIYELKDNNNIRYIIARLKFFALSDAPEYIVLVGSLKPDFVIPNYKSLFY